MSAVRARDTRPELLPGPRVAVFVDGDFWHGNAWRARRLSSFEVQFNHMNNVDFWHKKITPHNLHNKRVNSQLATCGRTVYRIFESRLAKEIDIVCQEIEDLIRKRGPGSDSHPAPTREARTHA